MVARLPEEDGLLLLESTSEGVAVYHLDARLDYYRKDTTLGMYSHHPHSTLTLYLTPTSTISYFIGFRRLEIKRTKAMIKAITNFVEEVNGKPYNTNFVEMVKAQFGGNNQKDNLNSYFCSQLVAAAYQRMVRTPRKRDTMKTAKV